MPIIPTKDYTQYIGVKPEGKVIITSPYVSDVAVDDSFEDGQIKEKYISELSINKLNFIPLESEGDKSAIVATLNASSEGLKISAALIEIDGTVTFSAGYDPTTKVPAGGAAADVNGGVTTISGGKITAGSLTVTSAEIVSLAAEKITSQIVNAQIADIDFAKIDNVVITTALIENGAVTNLKIGDGAVRTIHIQDANITQAKIANLAVGTAQIANAAITDAKIDTLTATKIVGGTLSVGGSSNLLGIISVKNSSNTEIARMNNSGVIIRNTRGLFLEETTGGQYWDLSVNSSNQAVMSLPSTNQFFLKNYSGDTNLFTVSNSRTFNEKDFWANSKLGVGKNPSDFSEKFWVEGSAKITDNLKSDHHDPNGNKQYNLGGEDIAWDFVYADDFVNMSMGWYDEGVEMQDGRVLSDMEAIRQIKPHKTMRNKNGSIKLDPSTLPLAVFREAKDRETGKPFPKNKDGVAVSPRTGEAVGDGESLTHMVSLLLGAIKEVDKNVSAISKELEVLKGSKK